MNFLYIASALIPPIALLIYVYRKDTIEKEPATLLWKLVFGGLCAAILASFCEFIFMILEDAVFVNQMTMMFIVVDALSVGIIEECSKFYFLKKFSWYNREFNYRFDGLVYSIFVSLSFAAIENVLYVFMNGGLTTAILRAFLAIPAHMCFSVIMGIYYGRAKICEIGGNPFGKGRNLFQGIFFAILAHAFYDGTLMVNTNESAIVFVVFVILMYLYIFLNIRHEAKIDATIL